MKTRLHHLCLAIMILTAVGCSSVYQASSLPGQSEQQALIEQARTVMTEMRTDKGFPLLDSLLPQSCAILVYPELIQIGIGFGGIKGKGVLFLNNKGNSWKPLALYTFEAASAGVQLGVSRQSLLIVILNDAALQYVLHNPIFVNVDLFLTAGSGTFRLGTAKRGEPGEIYYFSKVKGPFAGVYLENGTIRLLELLQGAPLQNGRQQSES